MGDSSTTVAVAASAAPSGSTNSCRLYEAETFSRLLGGLKVAACMISDSPPIVDEASVVREAESINENRSGQGGGCSSCSAGPFESRAQQIAHYKHHWHTYNLRRRLLGRPALTLLQFNARDDDESVSDSESDTEIAISKGDKEVSDLFLAATRHCRAYFTNIDGRVLSVYRCLLHHKKEWIGGDGKGDKWVEACKGLCNSGGWAVIMCAGGHFAGGIFRGDSGIALKHKTLHSYVTRRGQGKAQGTRDARGNAPKSAGASLRRYNQEQFAQHVQEVLTSWKDDLAACSLILYRAVGPLNKASIFGAGSPLYRQDLRLRTLPFPTRRPSYKEIQRAYSILATIEIYESFEVFQKTFGSTNNPSTNSVPDRATGRKAQKCSPQKIDRAKSRETTLRPTPGAVISSEDEVPCYDQSMGLPNWTKTLAKHSNLKNPIIKKSEESESDDEVKLVTAMTEINMKDSLQEFDNSLKKKTKKKSRRAKTTNMGSNVEQNNLVNKSDNKKDYQADNNKTKSQISNSKVPKVPTVVRKLWESLIGDNIDFNNLLNMWDAPISLEDSLNFQDPVDGNTILHKAAIAELPSIVMKLMELGADPCYKNLLLQTPYCVTCHQETRVAFRLFQGLHPKKYQYAKANIPGPLTPETIDQEKEKKAMQKKLKRQKDKEKQQEKIKTNKFLELNDKQKLSSAQENRCFTCGGQISSMPFSYENYKFCNIKCLQHHRNARPLNLSTQ
ncbi:tRNA endonuclease ANKZF1-like [Arctopsyche grandis]|uniref:tRNA endonuclease ANKZF1-like n=1 Tax=Arctopsyche grandis TaxID=121162 RepID=UPI00406D7C8B